jgi:hypothetical protein
MILNGLVVYTICGLLAITFLDVIGAVASRKFKFLYTYLTVLSLMVYTALGYFVASNYNAGAAIMSACLVGIYDATAGWNICTRLNANFGLSDEQIEQVTMPRRITTMLIMASAFGYIGSLIATPHLS